MASLNTTNTTNTNSSNSSNSSSTITAPAVAPAAAPAPAEASEMHASVLRSAEALKIQSSTLRGLVSVHTMRPTTPFSGMFKFQKLAVDQRHGERAFVGSIEGNMVLSINTGYGASAGSSKQSKKRARDTSEDDAERAVSKVRRGDNGAAVTAASYAAAAQCVASLLRLRGAGGERVVESWAVSMRKKGEWGATQDREALVLAARLTAGVALPLGALCAVVRTCRDGLLTVDTDKVDPTFDLPLSDQGKAAQGSGQRSILLMAAVPHLTDPAKV